MITQGGAMAYVRDGKVYEGGLFGGDLDEAVRGNPEAERHAHAYSTGMAGGFAAVLLGAAGLISGLVVTDEGRSRSGSGGNDTETAVGTGLLIGGAAAYIAGFVLMLNAQPHQLDAINVYNDGVPEPVLGPPRRQEQSLPGPGSPWAPPSGAGAPPPPPGPPPPPNARNAAPPPAPAPAVSPPSAMPAAPGS